MSTKRRHTLSVVPGQAFCALCLDFSGMGRAAVVHRFSVVHVCLSAAFLVEPRTIRLMLPGILCVFANLHRRLVRLFVRRIAHFSDNAARERNTIAITSRFAI